MLNPNLLLGAADWQVSRDGEDTDLVARGRHDPCVVPRAVPMVEAMVALVLADQALQARPANPSGALCQVRMQITVAHDGGHGRPGAGRPGAAGAPCQTLIGPYAKFGCKVALLPQVPWPALWLRWGLLPP